MDWASTSSQSRKRALEDCEENVTRIKPKKNEYALSKTISEFEKVNVAESKGLSSKVKIFVTTSDGKGLTTKANDVSKALKNEITNHRKIEEIQRTRNSGMIFKTSSPECQREILGLRALCESPITSRIFNEPISVKYVIHDIDTRISLLELSEELDYAEIDWYQIVRFTKFENGKRIPTPSVMIKEYGNSVPEKIILWYMRHRVSQYIEKPRMCFNCLRFGHTKIACKGNAHCNKCSENHSINVCERTTMKCYHCKGNHEASSTDCPHYMIECEVLKIKSEKNISYYEAKKHLNKHDNTYARVVAPKVKEDDTKIKDMQLSIDKLTQTVEMLMSIIVSDKKMENFQKMTCIETESQEKITIDTIPIVCETSEKTQKEDANKYDEVLSIDKDKLLNVEDVNIERKKKNAKKNATQSDNTLLTSKKEVYVVSKTQ